jgi:hypothetical protein
LDVKNNSNDYVSLVLELYIIHPVILTVNTTNIKEKFMRKMSEKKQSEKNINSIMKRQKLNTIMKRHKLNTMRSGSSGKNEIVGIKKQYLKSDGSCKVTLSLPKEAAPDAQVVAIVGDFNNWNLTETQMKKLKSGDFQLTLKLPRDREYRFRYLVDSTRWENDWCADKYVPNSFGCDDSLVIV